MFRGIPEILEGVLCTFLFPYKLQCTSVLEHYNCCIIRMNRQYECNNLLYDAMDRD